MTGRASYGIGPGTGKPRDDLPRRANPDAGFTLLELVVVLVLAAILVAIAVPSYRTMMQDSRRDSAVQDIVADFAFARSEALRRNTTITLCRSSDGTTCATNGDGYQRGWIVFPDGTSTGTHATDGSEPVLAWDGDKYFDHTGRKVPDKYTLTPKLWEYLQNYAAKHKAKGNGFGFGLVFPNSVTRTLSARYYKDGSEILIYQGEDKNPRRLTPRECARLMGFPDSFRIPVSDTRAYKQFGNSVVVDVMRHVAQLMQPKLDADILEPELPLRYATA